MADFLVNKAGAKIYQDIEKHKMLEIPKLSSNQEQGIIHEVLSVGFLGGQRESVVTIKESDGSSVAYRLPEDLRGWVENSIGLKLQGIELFPAKVEFGILDNRPFAEII